MRSMTVFNYLLEATVIGSVMILLLIAVRALLRERLGSRAIYVGWLLVALRLLLPLSLPNPIMDEFRPGFSVDMAARPVAAQVRQRVIDAGYNASSLLSGAEGGALEALAEQTNSGTAGKWILLGWLCVTLILCGVMIWHNARFRMRVHRDRVRPLEGEEVTMLEKLCGRYKVRPLPVYFVHRLPSACLVGVVHPFIAVPLDTAPEHLSLVLAHELCHRRSHDPLWSIVRNLCVALHWFNPLVWLGARLSRVDGEMACDDRVTARLQDIDRLAYANSIVSTYGRGGNSPCVHATGTTLTGRHLRQRVTAIIRCVRGNRWAIALGSLAAAAVLLVSFATSESEPLPTVEDVPEVTWTAAASPLEDADAAIACAKRFFGSAFIHEDTDQYAFTAALVDGQWRVEARPAPDSLPIVMRFSRDGHVLEYDGTRVLSGLSFTDTSYTHRSLTDSVDSYIRAFMTALVPGAQWDSAGATADVRAGDVRLVDVAMRGEDGAAAYQLTLQVEPAARVLYYLSETAG